MILAQYHRNSDERACWPHDRCGTAKLAIRVLSIPKVISLSGRGYLSLWACICCSSVHAIGLKFRINHALFQISFEMAFEGSYLFVLLLDGERH